MILGPTWEIKVWGRVLHIFHNEHTAVSWLKVNQGYQCSKHHHADRHNSFLVLRGVVCIEEWQPGFLSRTVLRSGQQHVVVAGRQHRFRVLETGEMMEVYWPDWTGKVCLEDIIREDVGGRDLEYGFLIKELEESGLYNCDRIGQATPSTDGDGVADMEEA